MSETTKLNLAPDAPAIDRETYTHAVQHMIDFMEGELADRHDWCNSRWRYFESIFPEFVVEQSERRAALKFDTVPEDSDYLQRLRDARARLLWYVNYNTINIDEANEILAHGGLPMWGADEKTGMRLTVTVPDLELNVAAGSLDEAMEWVRTSLKEFIIQAMDGKPAEQDAPYIPGSAMFGAHTPYVRITRTRHDVNIPVSETMRPNTDHL